MTRGALVEGFDYVTQKHVAMTPAEWRAKYPPAKYRRQVQRTQGETWYADHKTDGNGWAAEAYAIIPAGK